MALNSKVPKVVSYIHDSKAWDTIYVILKLRPPCLWLICLDVINKAGMDKVLYYTRMTNISIIKSSSDLDNKELLPVSE